MSIRAAGMDGLTCAWVGDDQIFAKDDAGRQALAKAVSEAPKGTPVRLRAETYVNGFNRNDWSIRPGDVATLAKSGKGTPVLYREHDPRGPTIGVVTSSKAVKSSDDAKHVDTIVQDITVTGQPALDDLAAGIVPHFSIHAQPGSDTAVACTLCGEDFMAVDSDCYHFPGMRYEGERAGVVYSGKDISLAETTWTYTPAVPGTGLTNSSLADAHVQRLAHMRAQARTNKASVGAATMEDAMSDKQDKAPAQKVDVEATEKAPEITAVELAAMKAQLDKANAKIEVMEAKAARELATARVDEWRDNGRLIGDRDKAIAHYCANHVVIDEWMGFIAANPANAIGEKTGPAPTQAPAPAGGATAQQILTRAQEIQASNSGMDQATAWMQARNEVDRADQITKLEAQQGGGA